MKYQQPISQPKISNSNQNSPCLSPSPLSQDQQQSNPQNPQNHQLQVSQLHTTIMVLSKLKRISKDKKLTELKANNRQVNRILKKVYELAFYKREKNIEKFQVRRQLKAQRKKAFKQRGINKRIKQETQKFSPIKLQQNDINQVQSSLNLGATNFNPSDYDLLRKLKCYICHSQYNDLHHFYQALCPQCGQFNFNKRNIKANCSNLVAVVTGARIKIGFEIAVKLLRDGATVFATSRFFKDTFIRYQRQPDFAQWSHRLHIIQCDFTSSYQVQKMIEILMKKCKKIDILINNAAQTLVRPKQFFLQQIQNQQKPLQLPNHISEFYQQSQNFQSILPLKYPSIFVEEPKSLLNQQKVYQQNQLLNFKNEFIDHSIRDEFDQPLDKRPKNTWVQHIHQVSLIDCFTTQLVNSIVPFYLISKLKPLMQKTPEQHPSFIINVSSMEGVFYRNNKQPTHPHTNMAKAALNMISRTSGFDFAKNSRIFMNSVDTGWVTQQNPYTYKQNHSQWQTRVPLDCIDGAMRVLDPIYQGINHQQLIYGKFIKDYKQSNW